MVFQWEKQAGKPRMDMLLAKVKQPVECDLFPPFSPINFL